MHQSSRTLVHILSLRQWIDTGETIQIKAKCVVKFRVAKAAKGAILGTK
jgi:nucleoid DNA-binding protein